jgi:hypothetical protein
MVYSPTRWPERYTAVCAEGLGSTPSVRIAVRSSFFFLPFLQLAGRYMSSKNSNIPQPFSFFRN